MNLEDVRDKVAKKHGYDNWKLFLRHTSLYDEIIRAEDECMIMYAHKMCEEQKMICHREEISGNSILNAPIPYFE